MFFVWIYFAGGGLGLLFFLPSHTYLIFCTWHECGPIPGSE